MKASLIERLHEGGYSCVIGKGEEVRIFTQRGVADLYDLLCREPSYLKGASVADKVVGKAAAALMILGGISEIYADVISTSALALLQGTEVKVSFAREVPFIENRTQTGWCPLETASYSLGSAEEIFPVVAKFIAKIRQSEDLPKNICKGQGI